MKADCIIKMKPLRSKEFIEYINENCYVDETGGELVCKKCGCTVYPDFFEQILNCSGCDDL